MSFTFKQFNDEFPDEDACLEALFKLRFSKQPYCPKCGVVKAQFYRVKGRRCFACVHCRHQLYPTAGTIYHRSATSLKTWFTAMHVVSLSKNGVSALEIQRGTGVTYKTAWRIARQIRLAMKQDTDQLMGIVEADEAYIGGRRRSSNRFSNKTPLLGVVERGGRVRVVVVDHASASTAMPFLYKNVAKGAILHTDESGIYNRAHQTFKHHKVKHGAHEYVRGDDYTNTMEGFWGLLKPSWDGTYRWVSKKHMQLYVNEAVWKYNHRREPQLFRLLWEAAAQSVPVSGRSVRAGS